MFNGDQLSDLLSAKPTMNSVLDPDHDLTSWGFNFTGRNSLLIGIPKLWPRSVLAQAEGEQGTWLKVTKGV